MLISVAYSIHRPEMLALAEPVMWEHEAICLEEPPTPGFSDMLEGRLDIGEYLQGTDYEYPRFSAMSCELLRRMHAAGRRVMQVDVYLEVLAGIHERFAAGEGPADIAPGTLEMAVYAMEKRWYGALLRFYQASVGADFEALVDSVKVFGKADASRGRLRDDLRAQAIADLAPEFRSMYVEAGYVHAFLLPALRRRLPKGVSVRPVYLMESLVRELTGARQALGPGDVLTIRYTYNPEYEGREADLQAARSLVRIKILRKEEFEGDGEGFPHTRDEVEASRLVRCLSYEECRELYRRIRRLPTDEARAVVSGYVDDPANGRAASG